VERLKRRGRRDVECHIVKDAGHYPFIDQPEEVFQIVEKARASCR
jgi:pimeloyl-ACP methyl ester carboxylesterase